MVEDRRLIIFLNVHVCFAKNSKYFILGREIFIRNGNRTLSIDAIVPMTEKNTFKYSAAINGSRLCDGPKLLGLVLGDTRVCDAKFAGILNAIFTTSLFHFMILPSEGPLRESVLVIPRYIAVRPCNEVIVVCLGRKTKMSTSNLPGWNNLENRHIEEEVIPVTLPCSSGLTTTSSVDSVSRSPVKKLFSLLLLSVLWFLEWITGLSYTSSIQYFLTYSGNFFFVTKQLLHRFNQISDMVTYVKEDRTAENMDSRSISCGNKMLSITIDIILGLIVVNFLLTNQDFLFISTWIVGQKYTVAEHLQNLLKWLMGVPAGLKLNKPLDQFLGHFYTYHVHLWTSYLYFIEAYLPNIIWVCSLSGYLGITFILSVVCDVLSLLTMHIYCFYIYAARLYKLEIHALLSLLRLFTGKKWNILRNRVDSLEYDVDRLFIGTLLFTILLFLFPTIFLYYIVFTALRLFVLIVQAAIFGVVAVFNSFPFWGLWLYFMNPECLPGRTIVDTNTMESTDRFTDVDGSKNVHVIQQDSALFLLVKYQCLPLRNLFRNCAATVVEETYYGIFGGKIFRKLLTGQLYSTNKH